MTVEIEKPIVLPGQLAHMRNYRSKPHEPWVLVKITAVKTGWRADGTYRHSYAGVRLNSPDLNDIYRKKRSYNRGEGGPVFLYCGPDTTLPY